MAASGRRRPLRRRDRRRRATTASSPPPTSPAPGCGRSSSSAASIVGGACTTEEFAPGFLASPGAYVLSLLRPAIWRDFAPARARARGARGGADPERLPRRRPAHARTTTIAETAARAGPLRPPRRRGLPALSRRAGRDRRAARAVVRPPAPRGARAGSARGSLRALGPHDGRRPPPRARGGEAVRDLRPRPSRAALPLRAQLRGARLGLDLEHARRARRRPGTAYSLLHEHAAAALGGVDLGLRPRRHGDRSPGCSPRPPSRRAPRSSPGRPVERIAVEDGRAAGVAARRRRRDRARRRCSRTPIRSAPCSALVGRRLLDSAHGRGDRGLPLRRRQPEDQPRARRAAADRRARRPGFSHTTAAWSSSPCRSPAWTPTRRAPAAGSRRRRRTSSSACPSALDPSLAPPGRHVVNARLPLPALPARRRRTGTPSASGSPTA